MRPLCFQPLEPRWLMHADVNLDGHVTAADALVIINGLSQANTPHVIDLPHRFWAHDVNSDSKISALDALIVLNTIAAEKAAGFRQPITVWLSPQAATVGLHRDHILWAINEAFDEYEAVADIDMQLVDDPAAQFAISSGELYLGNGRHARGWNWPSIGSRLIQFHNGQISRGNSTSRPNEAFEWVAFPTPQPLKQVLMHEIGHALMRWNHDSDRDCLMHRDAATDQFCQTERDQLFARFGRSRL